MGGTYGPLPKVMLMAVLLVIWSEKDIHDRANIQDCWWAPCASWEDLLLVGFMLISWVHDFIIWFYGLQNHILFEIYLTYYGIPWWWTTHERTLNHSSGLSSLLDEQRQQGCLNNGDTKLADLISTTWKPKTIAWTPWIFWVMLALGFWDAYETSVPICFFKNDVRNLEKCWFWHYPNHSWCFILGWQLPLSCWVTTWMVGSAILDWSAPLSVPWIVEHRDVPHARHMETSITKVCWKETC